MEPPGSHSGRVTESREGGRFFTFRPPGPSSEVAPLELGWPSLGLCVAGREAIRLEWELIIELSEKSEGLLQWLSGKKKICLQFRKHRRGGFNPCVGEMEGEMATLSSILVWKIPWTEEPQAIVHGVTKSRTQLSDWAHMHAWKLCTPVTPLPPPSILARDTPRTGHQDSWHGPKNKQRLGQQPLPPEPPDNRSAVHSPPVNKLLCLREHDNSSPCHPALSLCRGRSAITVLTDADMAGGGQTFPEAVYNFYKLPSFPSSRAGGSSSLPPVPSLKLILQGQWRGMIQGTEPQGLLCPQLISMAAAEAGGRGWGGTVQKSPCLMISTWTFTVPGISPSETQSFGKTWLS